MKDQARRPPVLNTSTLSSVTTRGRGNLTRVNTNPDIINYWHWMLGPKLKVSGEGVNYIQMSCRVHLDEFGMRHGSLVLVSV